MKQIPEHMKKYEWYASHLAWLKANGVEHGYDFGDAKPMRADLSGADLRGADLRGAYLHGAYLHGAYLRGARLRYANLRGAYLCDADLRDAYLCGAYLRDAYLCGAYLRGAYLRGADLSDAGIPSIANIDKAIYEAISKEGCSLNMEQWHTCETTHCRAGWAVVLAGEKGRVLEKEVGTNAAGALIYAKSRPDKRVPDWYASDEEVMEELELAAKATGE